jgi:hypothetical protein
MKRKIKNEVYNKLNLRIAAISLIVSFIIGLAGMLFSIHYNEKQIKREVIAQLENRLDNINAEQMNYPYLEDSIFIVSQANKIKKTDSSLRYTIYCERVFNFLQDLTEENDYNRTDIEKFVDIHYFVKQHKAWILKEEKDPLINKAYPKKFISFINSYLDK